MNTKKQNADSVLVNVDDLRVIIIGGAADQRALDEAVARVRQVLDAHIDSSRNTQ